MDKRHTNFEKAASRLKQDISDFQDELNKAKILLNLESQLKISNEVIKNYPSDLVEAKRELARVQDAAGNSIGYTPSKDDIDKATQRIIDLSERAALAEITIEDITPQIGELKEELEQLKAQRLKDNPQSVVKDTFSEYNGLVFESVDDFANFVKERN
jgi:uncharacterized coiled-coil protein SlyX